MWEMGILLIPVAASGRILPFPQLSVSLYITAEVLSVSVSRLVISFRGITCSLQICSAWKKKPEEHPDHFILSDTTKPVDFGEGKKNIFAYEDTEILVQREKEVQMAVHEFGKGRCVYISGLPYSFENSRILYRSILWSTHGEKDLHQWFSSNFNVEVHAYVKNGRFCVVNNTYARQKTVVYRGDGSSFPLEMEANEIKWYNI